MKFNSDEFIHNANHDFLKQEHHMRYGQFLMYYLQKECPSFYALIPESADCFYDNHKCVEFLKWIYSLHDLEVKNTM